jgi:signal transduction histidine kinase/class 3 adenylate cyclase
MEAAVKMRLRLPRRLEPEVYPGSTYEEWRLAFTQPRLWVGLAIALVGSPSFVVVDFVLYRPHAVALLALRAAIEIGLIAALLLSLWPPTERKQTIIFLVLMFSLCLPISHMTTLLGGFASTYYFGLIIVFFGAAVLIPVRWERHAAAQIVTLLYYYCVNFVREPLGADYTPALESGYFLLWTGAMGCVSAALYERLLRREFQVRSQLQASNRKLLELDQLKSQFFANISHELRTPLTLVIGSFKGVARELQNTALQSVVTSGLRSAVRLLYLINELLDLARFDSGRAKLRQLPVDLAAIVRQIASNFEDSVRHRIHLQGVNQPLVVKADPTQMKKLVYNLLSNAVKFSDPELGEVWIRLTAAPGVAELEVEDNGIGIAAEHLPQIFDRFTQIEGSMSRRYEGTGIGLALVKEIVTHHAGTIRVDSQLGRGSTFSVTLPRTEALSTECAVADEDDLALPMPSLGGNRGEAETDAPSNGSHGPLILVADDNPDMRQYLKRILGHTYRVVVAADGAEALEKAKAMHPDLILTDIMMPRISGHELLARLRADEELRTTPVVFLSVLTVADARISALQSGVDDVISKPFDEGELLVRVRNILAARQQQREIVEQRLNRLRRFLPVPIAKTLIEEGAEARLRSHRSEVTVVFFDLRGFTRFAQEAEPEELMEMLRDYQTKVGTCVDEYGGTLEQFTGDSIMVFFNDPIPMPDHAERAVAMAVAVRQLLPGLQEKWRKRGFNVGMGTGVALGYATLGMVGYERRQDYAAIGTVTNLAARLCARAKSGQILVPKRLANLLQDLATLEMVGALRLRGFRSPVIAYNVLGMKERTAAMEGDPGHDTP